jgi:hypothetical protein
MFNRAQSQIKIPGQGFSKRLTLKVTRPKVATSGQPLFIKDV